MEYRREKKPAVLVFLTVIDQSKHRPRNKAAFVGRPCHSVVQRVFGLYAYLRQFFYVALLNSLSNSTLYLRFPSMPMALAGYLAALAVSYFVVTYRAFRRRDSD